MDELMPILLVILAIAVLVLGPSKLPSLGKGVGEAIRSFKKGLQDGSVEENEIKEKAK